MLIAIASGKGGTGKTTLAVSLAKTVEEQVQLLDCDVEEPNSQLFVKGAPAGSVVVSIGVPQVDAARCSCCGECARFCRFNAIAVPRGRPLVFPELCHDCVGCMLVCPERAISMIDRRIGVIEVFEAGRIAVHQGRLDVGEALAPPLIRAVKAGRRLDIPVIIDAPPGTACAMVAAVRDCDFVILVTEPTPFGLHDLTLAVETVRELKLPFGVLVNRMGAGDNRVHSFCAAERIPILAEIPDDRRIAELYSRGEVLIESLPEYRPVFQGVLDKIRQLLSSRHTVAFA